MSHFILSNVPQPIISALAKMIAARAVLEPHPAWHIGSGVDSAWRPRKSAWVRLREPLLIKWCHGLRIYVYPGDEASRVVFLTGRYEPNEFCWLGKALTTGMTFVDVGAHSGLYSLFAAKLMGEEGKVLALEPSSREFQKLQNNVAINGLRNVRPLCVAASNRNSQAELHVAVDPDSGKNTLGAFGYETQLRCSEVVRTERLDDIVEQEGLSRLDVLKMDVEGAELLSLEGAVRTLDRFRPTLLLELSDRTLSGQGCSSSQVWEFLTQRGFRILRFDMNTGLPIPGHQEAYFGGENVIAIHENSRLKPYLCEMPQALDSDNGKNSSGVERDRMLRLRIGSIVGDSS
jgi:FkbM family methyltransferase